jgi:diguanylate cyclase (GGDEF)-like protein
LALGEVALVLLLSGLQGGLAAGAGQFLYFLLGSVLLGGIYPFNLNLAGCAALALVPHVAGALLVPGFPHVLYASTVWPAGALAVLAHWNVRLLLVENARLRHEVEASALIDPATGLLNMRGLEQAFQRLVKLGAFKPLQQFLLLIEIDGFDKIALARGQDFAVSLRGQFGQAIDLSFRSRDITASPAEEFACILQHVSREKAFDVAERFRVTVADKEFDCAAAETGTLKCTVSIGIVSADAKDDIKTLLNHARVGISQAKSLGGNQCVCI